MSGVPASSHGGAGLPTGWTQDGTTHDVIVANDGLVGDVPLTVQGGAGQKAADASDLLRVYNGDNLRLFDIDSAGDATFRLNAAQFSTFDVQRGNGASVALRVESAGATVLTLQKTNGDTLLQVPNGGGLLTVPPAPGTVAPVSATAFQCSTTRDVFLCVPFTGDATNNAATLLIQVSPDNVTFTTLDTLSIAAALNLTGAINVPVSLAVPAAWYVKLTASHGTIGTGTYY